MVEIEERRLGTFQHDLLAGGEGLVDEGDGVADHGGHPRRELVEVLRGDLVGVEREAVVDAGQDGVLLAQDDVELLAEDFRVEEILHAKAALGRAELVVPEETLRHPVELVVVRHDQVGVARYHEAAGVDPATREHVALCEEHGRVDDDAVADDRDGVGVEHTARDELEGEGLAVDDDRVAGVVAALVADDESHVLGEEIGELPLAFIAPLGSDHDGGGHVLPPVRLPGRKSNRSRTWPGAGAGPRPGSGWRAGDGARGSRRTAGSPLAAELARGRFTGRPRGGASRRWNGRSERPAWGASSTPVRASDRCGHVRALSEERA
jgi:hypothetical protein